MEKMSDFGSLERPSNTPVSGCFIFELFLYSVVDGRVLKRCKGLVYYELVILLLLSLSCVFLYTTLHQTKCRESRHVGWQYSMAHNGRKGWGYVVAGQGSNSFLPPPPPPPIIRLQILADVSVYYSHFIQS